MSKHVELAADVARLPEDSAKKVQGLGLGLLVVGLVAAAAAYFLDTTEHHARFAHAWLVAFTWLVSLALGGLFFVLIQHVTRAGWSVAPRRHAEWLSSILLVVPVLFLGVFLCAPTLYEHWMGAHAQHNPLIQAKSGYLNPTFFYVRAAIYFVIWAALTVWFNKGSAVLDEKTDVVVVEKMQGIAAPSLFLFGFSLTFASFDWLMSLDPHWYSTIFGVVWFAGGVCAALSAIILINIRLQGAKLLNRVSTVEHRHDLGKLLFGFIVFYAYVSFSQYFLIWYANIPEETIFYKHRWVGAWQQVSMLLLLGHFVLPFLAILSRHPKRNPFALGAVAVWVLFMHWIDMYWLVMPNLDHHGAHFTWIDIACWLGAIGVGAFVVSRRATSSPLFPLHDPRLAEAMRVENL